jgi:hypothetical protein
MIQKYAVDLATKMGIKLSQVQLFDGKLLGCRDCHLLQLHSDDQMGIAIVFQQDLEYLQHGITSIRLETRLRSALSRLNEQLEPYP